jgi:hypothetical protein
MTLRLIVPFLIVVAAAGPAKTETCASDPQRCTPAELCQSATETQGGRLIWRSEAKNPYLDLAKTLGMDCGTVEAISECEADARKCSIQDLCTAAVTASGKRVTWNTARPDHVAMAQSYKLACGTDGTGAPAASASPETAAPPAADAPPAVGVVPDGQLSAEGLALMDLVPADIRRDINLDTLMQSPPCPVEGRLDGCFAEKSSLRGEGGPTQIRSVAIAVFRSNAEWTGFRFEEGAYSAHFFEGVYFPMPQCQQDSAMASWDDWYYCRNGDKFRAIEGDPDNRGEWVTNDVKRADGTISRERVREGRWEYVWKTGEVYVGEFSEGQREGHGTYRWANGNVYEGNFKDGAFNGRGTYRASNGNVYVGNYADGKYEGTGTLSYANGDVYEGDFKDGALNGRGTYRFADGSVYEGELAQGMLEGRGRIVYEDGSIYVGSFAKDQFNGQGNMIYADGSSYVGGFADGEWHGSGRFISATGDVTAGTFVRGEHVGP